MYRRRLLTMAIGFATVIAIAIPGLTATARDQATTFRQTNLDSDVPGKAQFTDPDLVNPWGISSSRTSPMWVSDNGMGVTTLYRGDGVKLALRVTIPPAAGSPTGTKGTPTGTVFNNNNGNGNGEFNGDFFLFATEDGTIAGWKPSDGTVARTEVNNLNVETGPVFQGLAIAYHGAGDLLVGNFGDGRVNAYTLADGDFRGALRDVMTGRPIAIDGLWALRVGNGGGGVNGGDPNAVYFTAGIEDEMHGLFGTITNAGS